MNSTEFATINWTDCHKKITIYVRTPIDVTNKDYFYVLDPKLRPIRHPKGFSRGLHSAFGWVPANPNSSEAHVATTLLYEETCSNINSNSIPTAAGFKALLSQLTDDSNIFDLYLVGNRGSGKTFVQNKLINHNLDELNRGGFTYFRADVAKLHDFNARLLIRESTTDLRMSIQEYMALHAFFVVFSHGNRASKDPGLVKFHSDFEAVRAGKRSNIESQITNTSFSAYIREDTDSTDLTSCWSLIAKSFANKRPDPNKEDEDLFSYLENCRKNLLLTQPNILKIFDRFMQFITTDTLTVRVIFEVLKFC